MEFAEFFTTLTGRKPYPYQERLASMLHAGDSVVLRAPTGAGKTWATVVPFIFERILKNSFADRLLYALPMRTLATTIYKEVISKLQAWPLWSGPVFNDAKDREYPGNGLYCTLQIGGQPNDPFFEGDLVFTTIDQLLSGYLFHPVSLPRRLDNINAGALIGAYIVIDEIHLLDAASALRTTVEMLHRLRGLSRFVVMTATMSSNAIEKVCSVTGAKSLILSESETDELPTQASKRRTYSWRSSPLTATSVAADYRGGRAIVLANTVNRAQEIFRALAEYGPEKWNGRQPQLLLLHSRFFASDRQKKEARVIELFGPDAPRCDAILVTTQVIEAGIDISAETLHTELAPMNAIVQRAGRTARYLSPRNFGQVIVYELETGANGKPRFGPYRESKSLVSATREQLRLFDETEAAGTYSNELKWIEVVHTETEVAALCHSEGLRDGHEFRERVHRAMDDADRSCLGQLVRDANSVNVLITDAPETLNFNGWDPEHRVRIGWPRMLGVDPYVLESGLRSAFSNASPLEWVAKSAEASDDEARVVRFQWNPLESPRDIPSHWLLAIHPKFARYDSIMGLELGRAGEAPGLSADVLPSLPRYHYSLESWELHSRRIVHQSRMMSSAYTAAMERLATKAGVDAATVQQWVELACALHDTGKLSKEWQKVAWKWQRDRDIRRGKKAPERVPIAHTDLDPLADKDFSRQPGYRLPAHAVEGALAVADALGRHLSQELVDPDIVVRVGLALIWSIGRHHAPRAEGKSLKPFELVSGAEAIINRILPAGAGPLSISTPTNAAARSLGTNVLYFLTEVGSAAWPFYSHFIRRLRLADQQASSQTGEMDWESMKL